MNKPAALLCLLAALGISAFLALRATDDVPDADIAVERDAPTTPEVAVNEPVQPKVASEPGTDSAQLKREVVATEVEGHTLEGRVVDETGAGVASFRLSAELKPKGAGTEWGPVELGSFVGGAFRIDGLPEGRWRLRANADNHKESKRRSGRLPYTKDPLVLVLQRQTKLRGVVFEPSGEPRAGATVKAKYPGKSDSEVTDDEGAFALDIYPGDFEAVAMDELFAASDIIRGVATFGEPKSVELHLRAGGRVEGEALDREGLPLAGYSIWLRTTEWEQDKRDVQASEQGQFAFEHVAPGTYWLEALKDESDRSNGGFPIRMAIEVVDGETTHAVLGGVNPDAVTLSGIVYKAGVVQPETRVWGTMQGVDAFASGRSALANEKGEYELEYPGSGSGLILVSTENKSILPLPIVLTEEPEQEYDVHIPTGRISGRVLGVASGEFSRSVVSCKPEGRSPIYGIYLSRRKKCDEQGNFTFSNLPAGSYRVAIDKVFDVRGIIEEVELEADGEVVGLQLGMSEPSSADVLVVDAAGIPVRGAKIYAQDSAGHLYRPALGGETDVKGVQSFGNFAPGSYRFFAQCKDTASALSAPVQVVADNVAKAEVKLAPGARASIRVRDGVEPIYARLWIWDQSGNEFSRTLEAFDHTRYLAEGDTSESYSLGPLPPGKYRVKAKAHDGRIAEGDMVLRLGEAADLLLQMKP